MNKKIAIITGSKSDLPVVQKAVDVLKAFDVNHEVHIISAHRTPEQARNFAINARQNNFGVIIAIAGKAAHLAGVIASYTRLPVIGVPVKSDDLGGMDALLSTVQMPSGIPVAAVAINGAANAAYLALRILALNNEELANKIEAHAKKMTDEILEQDNKLQHEHL